MPAKGENVPFLPMPEPGFIRDPNLLHLIRSMRSNIMAAFGQPKGGGFLPRAEAAASATSKSSSSASSSGSSLVETAKMVQCAFDVSTGAGMEGVHYLAATLPERTVLVRVFCVVLEEFSGAGCTLAIRAGEGDDEFDVFAESALATGWTAGYHAGINIGQSAGERARAFKAVVAGGDISAGKLRFYAEYARCEA